MVITESMAHGAIPIKKDVGGINEHVLNNEHGIVICDTEQEKIVKSFTDSIVELIKNKQKIDFLSQNAYSYAHSNFQIKKFNDSYNKLLFKQN